MINPEDCIVKATTGEASLQATIDGYEFNVTWQSSEKTSLSKSKYFDHTPDRKFHSHSETRSSNSAVLSGSVAGSPIGGTIFGNINDNSMAMQESLK